MGKQRNSMPGLFKRYGIWRIDKKIAGQRIQESTGTSNYEEAKRYLVFRLEQIRQAKVYGERPKRHSEKLPLSTYKKKRIRRV